MTALRPERDSDAPYEHEPYGAAGAFEAAVDGLADPLNDPLPGQQQPAQQLSEQSHVQFHEQTHEQFHEPAYGSYDAYDSYGAVPSAYEVQETEAYDVPGDTYDAQGTAYDAQGTTYDVQETAYDIGEPEAVAAPTPDQLPYGDETVGLRSTDTDPRPTAEPDDATAEAATAEAATTPAPGGRAARRRAAQQAARNRWGVEGLAGLIGLAGRGRGGGRRRAAPRGRGSGTRAATAAGSSQKQKQQQEPEPEKKAAPLSRLEARRAERAKKPSPAVIASRAVGEAFITLGVLMLLFVTYQLWWTNVRAGEQAGNEASKIQEGWASGKRAPGAFEPGQGFAIMHIPRLDVVVPVAEGIDKERVLDRGMVGHYAEGALKTAMPGEKGNFAVAGHRNTHGEPFRYINHLEKGDQIVVETRDKYYVYAMQSILPQTSPGNTGTIAPIPKGSGFTEPGHYITLTTCTPEFTSTYRMIVWGKMVEERPRSKGKPDALVR